MIITISYYSYTDSQGHARTDIDTNN